MREGGRTLHPPRDTCKGWDARPPSLPRWFPRQLAKFGWAKEHWVGSEVKQKNMEEEEQEGVSVHSPCQAPPSSASSLPKEQSEVELELKLLEALEIYPPNKLQGIHRHIVLFGLMEFFRRSFDRDFSAEDILLLLDRFYNLDMLKSDDDDKEVLSQEEAFSLPQSFFVKEEL